MLKDHPLTYLFISVLTSFLLKFPWKSSQQMDNGLQMLLGPGCMLRITQDLQKASVFGDCIFPCPTYQTVKLRKALVATHSKSQKNKPNSNNSNTNNKPMSEKMANIFLWKETAFQIQKQTSKQNWRNSEAKCACCSPRGRKLSSHGPHLGAHSLQGLTPSSGPQRYLHTS